MSWKFVHNGTCWWIRIESPEQLLEYLKATDSHRYGDNIMRILRRHNQGHTSEDNHGMYPVSDAIEALWRNSGKGIFEIAGKLMINCHNTYYNLLDEFGFVDINECGGCNSFSEKVKAVKYSDKLVFPHYSVKDIRIKTYKNEELKVGTVRPSGYKYHYYAYLGDINLKDGDKVKWDTYQEAYDFAKQFVETM